MKKDQIYFAVLIVFVLLALGGWFILRGQPTFEQTAPAHQNSELLENESEAITLLEPGSKDPSQWEKVSGAITLKTRTANQVAKVVFYLDRTIVGEDTNPPFIFELGTTDYEDCMYLLRAKAYDEQGKELGEDRSQIWIDNTPFNCM